MTRLLITQGTHPFSQRLAKLLPGFEGYFGITDPYSPLSQTSRYLAIPDAGSPSFVHGLLKSCLDRHIELLIPLGQGELMPLARATQLFAEYEIKVLIPSLSEIANFPVLANPPRNMEPLVLLQGEIISGTADGHFPSDMSGVFMPSDDGRALALCCVAD